MVEPAVWKKKNVILFFSQTYRPLSIYPSTYAKLSQVKVFFMHKLILLFQRESC